MKKSIVTLSILAATLSSTSVPAAANSGNLESYTQNGSQVDTLGTSSAINIGGANSGNVATCVQSGSGNHCNITINTGGEGYDDTEVKADITANKNKISSVNRKVIGLTAEVEVAQDDIKANTDAINTVNDYVDTVNDSVYLVAAHARVAHETALTVNEDLVAAVSVQTVNNETQQADIDNLGETKADKTQVANDIKNAAESTLTASKGYTDTKVTEVKDYADNSSTEAKEAAIKHSDERDDKQDKKFNDYTIEQTKIDNQQSTSIEELYAQGSSQQKAINSNTNRIGALEGRVDKLEGEIAGIHNDNRRQDGMIAGVLAASTFEMPHNWNGEWALQAAIGSYNNQKALALGVVHAGEGYAIRATVTGTNADNFSELGYGASITLSTSLFK